MEEKTIKENVWYILENGEFVEAQLRTVKISAGLSSDGTSASQHA